MAYSPPLSPLQFFEQGEPHRSTTRACSPSPTNPSSTAPPPPPPPPRPVPLSSTLPIPRYLFGLCRPVWSVSSAACTVRSDICFELNQGLLLKHRCKFRSKIAFSDFLITFDRTSMRSEGLLEEMDLSYPIARRCTEPISHLPASLLLLPVWVAREFRNANKQHLKRIT
jgi:hypothetical protein